MRSIGLDVHRDFCEIVIVEAGEVRSAGRIATSPEALELFAGSLCATDRVALEATGNALGDRTDHRAARRPGAGGASGRHRDPPGAREDRPALQPRLPVVLRRSAGRVELAARIGLGRPRPPRCTKAIASAPSPFPRAIGTSASWPRLTPRARDQASRCSTASASTSAMTLTHALAPWAQHCGLRRLRRPSCRLSPCRMTRSVAASEPHLETVSRTVSRTEQF